MLPTQREEPPSSERVMNLRAAHALVDLTPQLRPFGDGGPYVTEDHTVSGELHGELFRFVDPTNRGCEPWLRFDNRDNLEYPRTFLRS
jgi:hypothetical protein